MLYNEQVRRISGVVMLATSFLWTMLGAAPLIVYQGDSIVSSNSNNGYSVIACPLITSQLGAECKYFEGCVGGCSKSEVTVDETRATIWGTIVPLAPSVFHYNPGVNNINCLEGASGIKLAARFGQVRSDVRRLYRDYTNALPASVFVYGEHTATAECVTGGVYCGTCGRENKNIIKINEAVALTCSEFGIPMSPLYATSRNFTTTDGRHYAADGALAIAKASVGFITPFVDGSRIRVFLTAPLFDTVVTANSSLKLSAQVAQGSATKVEFYDGQMLLGLDESAPYEHLWSGVPRGGHAITAKAYPSSGAPVVSPVRPINAWSFPIKVNCGGPATGDFLGDREYSPAGAYGFRAGAPYCATAQIQGGGTDVEEVYRTVRFGVGAGSKSPFVYSFKVPNGSYYVGLLRIDSWNESNSFGITIEGSTKENWTNLVPNLVAKGKPHFKEYQTTVSDGELDVSIWGNAGAMIAGIVINHQPTSVDRSSMPIRSISPKSMAPRFSIRHGSPSVQVERGNQRFDMWGRRLAAKAKR